MIQPIKTYDSYVDFTNNLVLTVMDEEFAVIIVRWEDYQGLLASLFEKTINGKSLFLDYDSIEGFDNDIATAKSREGTIMVTVRDDGSIMGEAVVYSHPEAYVQGTYFVEEDAQDFLLKPITGKTILFRIKQDRI